MAEQTDEPEAGWPMRGSVAFYEFNPTCGPVILGVRHHKMTDAEYLERFNAEYWQTLEDGGVPALSRLQRDALCIMSFQGEINNGGMHQYLLNSSGDFAKETPDVMRRIGADDAGAILEKANSYFGENGPPTDRETRMDQLLAGCDSPRARDHAATVVAFWDVMS